MRCLRPTIFGIIVLTPFACDAKDAGPSSEALAQVATRLDTTDERLAGLETKLSTLDERLAQISTWAEARKLEAELREQERDADVEALKRLVERRNEVHLTARESEHVDWLSCKEAEDTVMACTVSKEDFEAQLDNPAAMARWARVVPSQRDGETVGFKFYGVRPTSPLYVAGVHSGDLLTAVDGKSITSIDAAMETFVGLRKATSLRLELERRGTPWTLEISIVG